MSNTNKCSSSLGSLNVQKGAIIALIGIDGSGKSTFSKILANYFAKRGLKARALYLGNHGISLGKCYLFYLSLPLDITTGRFLPKGYKNSHRESRLSTFLFLMSKLLPFLNYVLIVLPYLWFYKKRGYIVVADRYVYDHILNTIKQGRFSSVLSRLLLRFTPVPLLTLVFDIRPEVAYLRKNGEKSLEDLRILRSLYNKLLKIIRAKRIDAECDFHEVFMKITNSLENVNPPLNVSLQSIELGLKKMSKHVKKKRESS
jgi:thymidylate kinase